MIEQGQIVLPRFQRHEAWRHAQIASLFENVLRKPGLPVGVLLVLEIGDKEPFHSRPIVGAPKSNGKPSMHLLDGQQRMTALWRTLKGDYPDLELVVSLGPPEETDDPEDHTPAPDLPRIEQVKRWDRKGVMQPVWIDHADQCFAKDLIPITCLLPGRGGEKRLEAWLADVKDAELDVGPRMARIYELRQRIAGYVVPFLALGAETSRETALDVFIRMNTSASPLKDFDIVTAQLEEASGQSLHDFVAELLEAQPAAKDFGKIEDIILSVAALVSGKPPLKKTYLDKDFGKLLGENWPRIMSGFKRGLDFLRAEAIFNEKCLPTDVAVYLVCALWADVPEHGFDNEGNARTLIRKALWRSCYTDRFGKTSATRAFSDYKSLSALLLDPTAKVHCELFDEETYGLPEVEELIKAGWPGRKDRLPRATLATALRAGGTDFADGAQATAENLRFREYHHIYPVNVLSGDRADELVNRAMNCALITWKTNRKIAAKTPKEYIENRAKSASLGQAVVEQRLGSHLIPYDALVEGKYKKFLKKRAKIIHKHMRTLCDGGIPEIK
jgi:hypothetical protein